MLDAARIPRLRGPGLFFLSTHPWVAVVLLVIVVAVIYYLSQRRR